MNSHAKELRASHLWLHLFLHLFLHLVFLLVAACIRDKPGHLNEILAAAWD